MAKITEQDMWLLTCDTYEVYLDHFRTREDLIYIRESKYTRLIALLGYRSQGSVLTQKQFEARRKLVKDSVVPQSTTSYFTYNEEALTDPVLRQLALRQIANHQKIITTIIFVCYKGKSGFDITGYIDYEDSLRKANEKTDDALDWKGVFAGKKKIIPRRTDLSYHNWKTGAVYYNDSSNYEIKNIEPCGLNFMYRGDRKMICTNPTIEDSIAKRNFYFSDKYHYVVLYDYFIRKKI